RRPLRRVFPLGVQHQPNRPLPDLSGVPLCLVHDPNPSKIAASGKPRAVQSLSWEAGVEQSFARDRFMFAATYFDQRFRDMIQYRSLPFESTEPNYENVVEANACGGRGEAKRRPSAGMGGTAGAVGNSLLARARSVVRELDLDPVRDQPRLVAAVQEELYGTAPVLPVVQRAGVDVHADEFVGLRAVHPPGELGGVAQ